MIDAFFAFARERHAIHLRRAAGQPPPWTEDPILAEYRFTNVFRELDRTTSWFRKNVRDPLRDKPGVLLATVVFRLFNRITTGEAIFQQRDLITGESLFDIFQTTRLPPQEIMKIWRGAIKTYCGSGPYVTGAFMVKTPLRMPKLDGVLWMIEQFATLKKPWLADGGFYEENNWREYAQWLIENPGIFALQDVWSWLKQFPYIGDFQAYEIVTDLRHTALLDRAPDINTWASAGPGARKGLEYIYGKCGNRAWQIEKMREMLEMSRDDRYWPQPSPEGVSLRALTGASVPVYTDKTLIRVCTVEDWPAWELREVEMWLCETAKYLRVKQGGHRPKQRYRYA